MDGERARARQHVLVRDPAAPGRRRPTDAGAARRRRRSPSGAGDVLVVEDDRRSADLLRVYLEGAGYRVAVARDGVEGLELARRLAPAAVILDILLPAARRLGRCSRGSSATPRPRRSRSSSSRCSTSAAPGFALGAAEYLVKPVDREELLRALDRCVAPPRDGRTVVVIDDDPLDLDLVEAALGAGRAGRSCAPTAARRACELVRRERPAVVLLDLLMPDVDGFAVVERLRADPALADVPIVVLTAKDMTRRRSRAAAAAASASSRGRGRSGTPSSPASSAALAERPHGPLGGGAMTGEP